jgi:hypothetical protein
MLVSITEVPRLEYIDGCTNLIAILSLLRVIASKAYYFLEKMDRKFVLEGSPIKSSILQNVEHAKTGRYDE